MTFEFVKLNLYKFISMKGIGYRFQLKFFDNHQSTTAVSLEL